MFNCVRISILERCSSVKYHLGMAGRRAEKAVEKARRKAPLGREEVVGAALGLLDEVGLDGLTTRRLAEKLGVRVGALYWHVSSKQELLAAIAGRIMEEFSTRPVAEGGVGGADLGGGATAAARAPLSPRRCEGACRHHRARSQHPYGRRTVPGYIAGGRLSFGGGCLRLGHHRQLRHRLCTAGAKRA